MPQQRRNSHSFLSQQTSVKNYEVVKTEVSKQRSWMRKQNDIWFLSSAAVWLPVMWNATRLSVPSFFSFTVILPKIWRAMAKATQKLFNITKVVKYSRRGIWIPPKPKVSSAIQHEKAKLRGSWETHYYLTVPNTFLKVHAILLESSIKIRNKMFKGIFWSQNHRMVGF